MKLMLDGDLKGFPPRLPEQPIFYPVLNKPYADQIARSWNTKDKFSGYVGFVTEFKVASPFIDQFEEQVVGAGMHNELWIPSEQVEELNQNILGRIQLVDVFYGNDYMGLEQEGNTLDNKSLVEQFIYLKDKMSINMNDSKLLIREHWQQIFMNACYWNFAELGITEQVKADTLSSMIHCWDEIFPDFNLFLGTIE
ncbi:hypothetical protein [Paenibacillus sp. YIM B09110]|uniref:hypothetical protein n=1 Tax=Paenibacillus sp. YIM B09110 TaxID=3126102 RepID=UPI00301C24C9